MQTQDYVSKEFVLESIRKMPDKIRVDELIDEILYLYKIEIGLAQSEGGKVVTLEDMRKKVETWKNRKSQSM